MLNCGGIIGIVLQKEQRSALNAALQHQPLNPLPFNQMLLDNFIEILLIHIGIPGFFRVNDYNGAFVAAAEAAGAVDSYLAFAVDTQFFTAVFYIFAHLPGIKSLAAGGAVFAVVGAKEYVSGVIGHFDQVLGLDFKGCYNSRLLDRFLLII